MFELLDKPMPIPPRKGGPGGKPIYPFAQMEVGGPPFDAPSDMGRNVYGTDRRQNTVSSAARRWAKRHCPTAKFTTRTIDENTVRCWRVK